MDRERIEKMVDQLQGIEQGLAEKLNLAAGLIREADEAELIPGRRLAAFRARQQESADMLSEIQQISRILTDKILEPATEPCGMRDEMIKLGKAYLRSSGTMDGTLFINRNYLMQQLKYAACPVSPRNIVQGADGHPATIKGTLAGMPVKVVPAENQDFKMAVGKALNDPKMEKFC